MRKDRCAVCGSAPAAAPGLKRLLPRAARTSALVGTVLVVLNQGDALALGAWPASLWWRIPLTFLVPFTVSLHAGYLATRR